MSGEGVAAAEDRAWDLLSRAEESTLGWIRELRDEVAIQRGEAVAQALLTALAAAGAVVVAAVATGATGMRHGFRRADVEFSIETDDKNPALIRIRFGRLGP